MAQKVADAFVSITGDNSPLRRILDQTRNMVRGFFRDLTQGIGQGIGQAIFGSLQRALGLGVGLIKEAIGLSSDLSESLNKTVVAFGNSAKAILDWSKTSATSVLLGRGAALEAASGFGLLFT